MYRRFTYFYSSALLVLLAAAPNLFAEPKENAANEFGLWHRAVPGLFVPLNDPVHTEAHAADLADDAEVIGLVVGEEARAYPLRLMTYHHVANETLEGKRIAVTYCIMANTAVSYELKPEQGDLEAGGLFGGVLALREQETKKCWPQIADIALPEDTPTTQTLRFGPPVVMTTWERWKELHPETLVLAPDDRFSIRYDAYDRSSREFSPNPLMNASITHIDERLDSGEEVFGLAQGRSAIAITLKKLRQLQQTEVNLNGKTVRIRWDSALDTPVVEGDWQGFALRSYWYAWSQFYHETELIQ